MATTFFTGLGVLLVAAAAGGWVTRRLGLTQTVGELLAGAIVGPTVLGHVWPTLEQGLFPAGVMPSLQLFALFVVLVYVAQTAAQVDRKVLAGSGLRSLVIVAVGTVVAIASGVAVHQVSPQLVPHGVSSTAFVLVAAAALLVTALPVLARILDETGLTRTSVGSWALALAVYVDFIAFTIAAAGVSLAHASFSIDVVAGPALIVALIVGARSFAPLHARIRRVDVRIGVDLAILIGALAAASATGASTLLAAAIVGALLWRRRPGTAAGAVTAAPLVRALVPLYIAYVGLTVDLTSLAHPRQLTAALVILLVAVAGKFIGAAVAVRLLPLRRSDLPLLAALGNARGLTDLILIGVAHSAGVLSDDAYAAFVLMTLVTTAAAGALARPLAQRAAAARMVATRRIAKPATVSSNA
jgi:Kef-type K+ transport system membrane component KefB